MVKEAGTDAKTNTESKTTPRSHDATSSAMTTAAPVDYSPSMNEGSFVIHEGVGDVIHEGVGDVKGRLAVFDVRRLAGGGHSRMVRWVKGFRGFAPEFVVVLPGEAGRVKRPGGGQG